MWQKYGWEFCFPHEGGSVAIWFVKFIVYPYHSQLWQVLLIFVMKFFLEVLDSVVLWVFLFITDAVASKSQYWARVMNYDAPIN
jgi:hypothetical protein